MHKTALVLSGGGAKGSFQAAAEKYAREEAGYTWDIISGVSVGALNGAMLAMEAYDELEKMWKTISNDQILTGKKNWLAAVKMLFGAESVHGHDPLRRLIAQKINPNLLRTRLIIGMVDLLSGEYKSFDTGMERFHFREFLLASTSIPVLFPPVEVPYLQAIMVDGAIRNLTPLGDVLDFEPDRVVVINCNPRKPGRLDKPPKNALEIGERSLEIMTNEIFVNDIDSALRINRLVAQAAASGVVLHKGNGKPYRHYKCVIIEPDEPLGYTLDFSRKELDRAWALGWEKAKEVLG